MKNPCGNRRKRRTQLDLVSGACAARASKDEVTGEMGGALKVRLRPGDEGRANEALVEFLAEL